MTRLSVVTPLVALLLTAGCAVGASAPPTATPAVGATPGASTAPELSGIDRLFLTMMVAHTEQTLEIVRLARDRVTDAELRTLVAAIDVTEADELATMRDWLRSAGPSAGPGRHAHDGHGVTAEELTRLRTASGPDADRVLREVLGAHQRSAADLARAHQAAGTDPGVRDLARRIEQSRTAEVRLLAG
ncbi:DUF305 domain-containing protein [Micromonospora sp. WMMD812]|uniref:DUF305 domain-containing protein n=1 Tax=Micromonospora sp. WMMD812 TaxID=3015152 RepID=UPI00248C1029|nr:DUF305 domain-containing protein [Micromonospora sp. WMMD812]WBB70230.1 DUF305 domain-containing protein [Micromonospora sp. WMMD812]